MQSDKEDKDKSTATLAEDGKLDSGDDGEEGMEGDESERERKKKRGASEEAVKPRPLHKTASIFLRNLAPTITKQEVEAVSRLCTEWQKYSPQVLQIYVDIVL
jgi:RNA recognition motif-containing protein